MTEEGDWHAMLDHADCDETCEVRTTGEWADAELTRQAEAAPTHFVTSSDPPPCSRCGEPKHEPRWNRFQSPKDFDLGPEWEALIEDICSEWGLLESTEAALRQIVAEHAPMIAALPSEPPNDPERLDVARLRKAIEALTVYRYILPNDDETTPTRTYRPFDMLRRDQVLAALQRADPLRERDWLVAEIVGYYKLYDHHDVWRERGAAALVDWLLIRAALREEPHGQ